MTCTMCATSEDIMKGSLVAVQGHMTGGFLPVWGHME